MCDGTRERGIGMDLALRYGYGLVIFLLYSDRDISMIVFLLDGSW